MATRTVRSHKRTPKPTARTADASLATNDHLLTVKEAAVVLGVCVRTLRKWIADRTIPFVRLPGGDLIRFRRSSLERFIARHEQRAL